MKKEKNNAKKFFCGLATGAANGVFGGGGGMLAVPLLQATGLEEKKAHATAILVILPISAMSFLVYALRGVLSSAVLIPVALGVTFGGFLGARLLGKLSKTVVGRVFGVLQIVAGLFLLLG